MRSIALFTCMLVAGVIGNMCWHGYGYAIGVSLVFVSWSILYLKEIV